MPKEEIIELCFFCLFVYSDVQHFVLFFVFMFLVPCCDVRYDFYIKMILGSFLPPVVCRRPHVIYMLFSHSGVRHVFTIWVTRWVSCKRLTLRELLASPPFLVGSVLLIFLIFCVVFLVLFVFVPCLLYTMFPVSLDSPLLIVPSVFSKVYLV